MFRQRIEQKYIKENWNIVVDALNQSGVSNHIEKLDPKASCNGFTYGYKLYAVQGQRKEYVQALRFVANLHGKKEIDDLVKQYQAAKSKKWCGLRLMSDKPDENYLEKLKYNELCLYVDDGKLAYVVKDSKGKIYESPVNEDELSITEMSSLKSLLAHHQKYQKLINAYDTKLDDTESNNAILKLFNLTSKRGHTQSKDAIFLVKIGQDDISFDKVIAMLEGVHFGQSEQNLSQIGAMWDKNYIFVCGKAKLADQLAAANLKEGESVFMVMGRHIFYIEKAASWYYLFESNAIGDEAFEPEIIKTEKQLANQICTNNNFCITSNNNVGFCMQFISYGSKSNRALEDAIDDFGDALKHYPHIKQCIDEYYQKRISRLDCALLINSILQEQKNNDVNFLEFQAAIGKYIKNEQAFVDKQFTYNKMEINEKAYTWDVSLLFLASMSNQVMFLKELIQAGADINVKIDNQFTPLYVSSENGYIEIVNELIQAGADINVKIDNQCTPLYVSSQNGHIEIVQALIQAGADINVKDKNQCTPLYISSQMGHIEIVELLLANKAFPDTEIIASVYVLMNKPDSHGRRSQIETLFKSKHAGNIPEQLPGFTPLHAAICFGHIEIVKALLKAGANENKKASGISCFEFAEAMGDQEIVAIFKPALTVAPTTTASVSSSSLTSTSVFFPPESEQTTTPVSTHKNDKDFPEASQQFSVTKKD